jgi:hypothetical protein
MSMLSQHLLQEASCLLLSPPATEGAIQQIHLHLAAALHRAQYRLDQAMTWTMRGLCHRVKAQDSASCTPGEHRKCRYIFLRIMIEILPRLAPPPSPFTLQGHLLQQQLNFRPESSSRHVLIYACYNCSDDDPSAVLALASTATWYRKEEAWAQHCRL